MNLYFIRVKAGYVKSIFKNKITYTSSYENAKPYNSSRKCIVAMANNKSLFAGMNPTITKVELIVNSVTKTEEQNRYLEQYQDSV